jgi:glycosyltransferase involved in cell wall biosynthesis
LSIPSNQKSIKVFHVITTFERGGAELALLNLSKGQVSSGYEVGVAFLKGNNELENEFRNCGVKVISNLANKNQFVQVYLLRKLFRTKGYRKAIVHSHLPRAELFTRLAMGRKCFVVTRHNAESFWPRFPGMLSSLLSRFVVKRALVCAISEFVKQFLIQNKEIVNLNALNVVYYSYSRFRKGSGDSAPKEPTFQADGKRVPRIGTVSRLTYQKGLDLLIHALPRVLETFPSCKLEIVGDGKDKEKLKGLVKELRLENHVTFHLRTENPDSIVSTFDLFVLASRYEGFGRVLLEAMDLKIPIVSFSRASIPEVLGLSHPGLVTDFCSVALAERIVRFIEGKESIEKVLKIQERRLEYFINYPQVERYRDIYSKLNFI